MANCPKCGASVREGKAFCPECGEPLGEARAASEPVEQPPEFSETVAAPPPAKRRAPPGVTHRPTATKRQAADVGAQAAGGVGEQRRGFFGRGLWVFAAIVLLLIVLGFLAVALRGH